MRGKKRSSAKMPENIKAMWRIFKSARNNASGGKKRIERKKKLRGGRAKGMPGSRTL